MEDYGPDCKMIEWLASITADSPKKRSVDMGGQCAACCPDLSKV
jgi:hypothetical protein